MYSNAIEIATVARLQFMGDIHGINVLNLFWSVVVFLPWFDTVICEPLFYCIYLLRGICL